MLGNLLTQPANAANIAAARAIVPDVSVPYANFSGPISQMLRPFPQVLWRDRRLRQRGELPLPFPPAHGGEAPRDDGLTVNVNYTFSRTEDDLSARTGYNFAQDWAVGVNDQPHVANAIVVYSLPFGASGRPGAATRSSAPS